MSCEAVHCVNSHYAAIMEKNLPEILSKYVPDPETYVILEGPRLTTIGFEKIKSGWTDFCTAPIHLRAIDWIEGPFSEESTDMAWVAGIIRLMVSVKDQSFQNTFRATFVLLRFADNWKIKHEHVSGALNDPYGIGDWLKPTT